MFNKVDILEKIGWYQDAEISSHDKLTDLFNCMVEYFTKKNIHTDNISDDIYVGGYFPINPETSFAMVVKRGYKHIEASSISIHRAYCAYCSFLKSPRAHDIASDIVKFVNGDLEFYLIDEFISTTYGKVL